MARTESFLFGKDPIGLYGSSETLAYVGSTPVEMDEKPVWYGVLDGSGDATTNALYVEPEKLSTQNAPGIRSLDDLNRMIIFAYFVAGSSDTNGVIQLARVNNSTALHLGPQIPFKLGNVASNDTGTGPIVTSVDLPLPSDFGQQSGGGDVNDQLWIRPIITPDFSSGAVVTNVYVLLVNGSGAAAQAFPHRGVVDSERRFW